ncbi:MAG: hypothetical protein JWP88_1125 [Flaviaesturariibacter sp.]|nr:hypothetical protein [Flaviaesturariibacter sp.]
MPTVVSILIIYQEYKLLSFYYFYNLKQSNYAKGNYDKGYCFPSSEVYSNQVKKDRGHNDKK